MSDCLTMTTYNIISYILRIDQSRQTKDIVARANLILCSSVLSTLCVLSRMTGACIIACISYIYQVESFCVSEIGPRSVHASCLQDLPCAFITLSFPLQEATCFRHCRRFNLEMVLQMVLFISLKVREANPYVSYVP